MDRVFSRVVLAWLALGGGAIALGLYAVSAEQVTNRTLLIAVALAGGGGGCISATAALVSYLGERSFRASWTAYFLFRPVLGAAIATLFYLVIRGGLVNGNAPPDVLNYYGVVAVALLAGLYSKGALDRMLAVYDVAFRRGPQLFSGWNAGVNRSTPPGPLDTYLGFIVKELSRIPESNAWLLHVWLQENRPQDLPSQPLAVGEGPPAELVRFRFTVFQHDYVTVEPQTASILARASEPRSEIATFRFDNGSQDASLPPTVLIEVSQHGRSVAVLDADDTTQGSE